MRSPKQIVLHFSLLLAFLLVLHCAKSQRQVIAKADIEQALADKKLDAAEAMVQKQVDLFWLQKRADSLNHYIFYTGKTEQLKTDASKGVKKVEALVAKIRSLNPPAGILRQTWIEAGEYFGFAGKNSLAYNANQQALNYTMAMPDKSGAQLGAIESNLGTYAQRMGDINLSSQHQRKALFYRLADPSTDAESLYISYNNMGGIFYYASKLDSAAAYFNKAIEMLKRTERTPVNIYYRPALVLNNISGIYSLQGRTTEAIQALQTCIIQLKTFIATKEPHLKKNAAISLQFEATDNLAGIYKELGNYKQAQDLLQHSYQQKRQALGKDDPAVFISQILLGQLYFAMKDNDKALSFLNEGLQNIAKADGDYTYWKADASNTLAQLYEARNSSEQAAMYYEKADGLYEESLQGEYDNIYLEFISNAALFYAANNNRQTALSKAKKAYDYIARTQGTETLSASYQLLNLSEVHYLSGNYNEALRYSRQSLTAMNKAIRNGNTLLDSVKTELQKPKAILQKAKAEYALLKTKDPKVLTPILVELNEALSILERRKTILNNADDISLLMAEQSELIRFVEKINADLFKATGDRSYLKKLIGLHESAMYNRIRSRLDKTDTVKFANLPASVQETERKLKAAITNSLEGRGTHNQKMQAYFSAVDHWNRFQESLKKDYPRYYQMRYASIFKSLDNTKQMAPANTTLVRYFFSGKELYAFVADANTETFVPLPVDDLENQITTLSSTYDVAKASKLLYGLYQQLWAPISKEVRNKKVVIIPDGILFNLSFETLTPKRINNFRELATNSILAQHSIAYHYSLFLLNPVKNQAETRHNFVAFAPGFTEQVKEPYRAAASTAAMPDMTYLSLLPQPFTIDLATKTQQMFGGDAYLLERSTENSFKQFAGNHKIIYIGTHAQSDNLHPEFSRLVFAKSNAGGDDNYLYLSEIYNCNLNADLAVVTACESGKAGYEDGEGMISLAHAFNYAGSKSILTGLWKIDEQTSAVLIEAFYKNLVDGLSKDEALRKAKLDYLKNADGRTLSPQYWAGLVIMGETSPISLETQTSLDWHLIAICALILLFVVTMFLFLRKPKFKERQATKNDLHS
ncbi:MAG: CHAT domain-containing protein [Chitinophagaceae bacterium]|nr:MAG: CHAT domain-containing protein [Chitinophagaceae bacterium]